MKTQLLFLNRINYLIRQKIISINPAIKDLKASEFNFLMFLYKTENFELSLKQLEYELQQSQSGINEISLRLESMGYIKRFKDPDDKRRLKAKLTETGVEFAIARDEEAYNDEQLLLEGITQEERDIYVSVASTIYKNSELLLKQRLEEVQQSQRS